MFLIVKNIIFFLKVFFFFKSEMSELSEFLVVALVKRHIGADVEKDKKTF